MGSETMVEVVEFSSKKLDGYTLIEGFPGPGLVGTIGIKHLIDKMDFKKYGYIKSNAFLPIIRIRDGKPVYPSRIFINEKKKILAVLSEQIIPKDHAYEFSRAITQWISKKKIRFVISLNGLNSSDAVNEETYGFCAEDETKKILEKHGVKIIEEGITSGINAMMMLELKGIKEVKGISLLAPVTMNADFKAAALTLSKLNEILNLKLEVKTLLEESEKAKKELSKYLESVKAEQNKASADYSQSQTPTYT
jgi:uncharacterized protein